MHSERVVIHNVLDTYVLDTYVHVQGEIELELTAVGAYAIVRAGSRHVARTTVETTMLFLTPGQGTEHRAI